MIPSISGTISLMNDFFDRMKATLSMNLNTKSQATYYAVKQDLESKPMDLIGHMQTFDINQYFNRSNSSKSSEKDSFSSSSQKYALTVKSNASTAAGKLQANDSMVSSLSSFVASMDNDNKQSNIKGASSSAAVTGSSSNKSASESSRGIIKTTASNPSNNVSRSNSGHYMNFISIATNRLNSGLKFGNAKVSPTSITSNESISPINDIINKRQGLTPSLSTNTSSKSNKNVRFSEKLIIDATPCVLGEGKMVHRYNGAPTTSPSNVSHIALILNSSGQKPKSILVKSDNKKIDSQSNSPSNISMSSNIPSPMAIQEESSTTAANDQPIDSAPPKKRSSIILVSKLQSPTAINATSSSFDHSNDSSPRTIDSVKIKGKETNNLTRPSFQDQLSTISSNMNDITNKLNQTFPSTSQSAPNSTRHSDSSEFNPSTQSNEVPILSMPIRCFTIGTLSCKYPSNVKFYSYYLEYCFHHPFQTNTQILCILYYKDFITTSFHQTSSTNSSRSNVKSANSSQLSTLSLSSPLAGSKGTVAASSLAAHSSLQGYGKFSFRLPKKLICFQHDFDPMNPLHTVSMELYSSVSIIAFKEKVLPIIKSKRGSAANHGSFAASHSSTSMPIVSMKSSSSKY